MNIHDKSHHPIIHSQPHLRRKSELPPLRNEELIPDLRAAGSMEEPRSALASHFWGGLWYFMMNMNYNVSWRYISIAYISMVMSYSEHGLEITGRTYSSILISRTLKQRLPKLPAPAGFVLGVSNVRGEYCHFMGVPFNKINHKPSTEQPVWPEPIDARSVHFRSLSSGVRLLTSGQPLESWQGERFVAPKPRRC